ncbi:MAG: hypothetical protein ABFS41_08100 [Myxococcota bacterium]
MRTRAWRICSTGTSASGARWPSASRTPCTSTPTECPASSPRTREAGVLRRLISALLLAALPSPGTAAPEAPRAREGTRLFEALEAAPIAVVGRFEAPTPLDRHGWRAPLVVEKALVGDAQRDAPLPVVWEELSAARAPRFAKGDRVLVVLEPLTGGSLWRERIPDVAAYLRTRRVAQNGLAFVRSPSLGSLLQLEHYLALPPAGRAGAAGQGRLLALVAEAEPALAVSAARQLAVGAAPGTFDAVQVPLVLDALTRAEREVGVVEPLLGWVERARPAGLADAIDRALEGPTPAPAAWVAARARLPGMGAEALARLLEDPSPARRAAAARAAPPSQQERLASLVRSDPAAEVRSAALARIAALAGPDATNTVLAAFGDRAPALRREAAELAAGLGADAVPRLRDVALGWPDPAPETAVLALRLGGSPAAAAVLGELAQAHPDARIRALAALAIGRPLGHAD